MSNKTKLTILAILLYLIPLITTFVIVDYYATQLFVFWPVQVVNEQTLSISLYFYCIGFIAAIISSVASLSSTDEEVRRLFRFVWIPYLLVFALIVIKYFINRKK